MVATIECRGARGAPDKTGAPMRRRQAVVFSPFSSFFALETTVFGALVEIGMLRGFAHQVDRLTRFQNKN